MTTMWAALIAVATLGFVVGVAVGSRVDAPGARPDARDLRVGRVARAAWLAPPLVGVVLVVRWLLVRV